MTKIRVYTRAVRMYSRVGKPADSKVYFTGKDYYEGRLIHRPEDPGFLWLLKQFPDKARELAIPRRKILHVEEEM